MNASDSRNESSAIHLPPSPQNFEHAQNSMAILINDYS